MKVLVFALASSSLLSPSPGNAAEGEKVLQLRPKEAILTSSAAVATMPHQYAPFVSPLGGPDLDLVPRRPERQEASPSSCNGERSLCYDPTSGHVVYKPARQFMPELPGLQPENISVKRDRIVFRYSF
jgi:hypothetical protein